MEGCIEYYHAHNTFLPVRVVVPQGLKPDLTAFTNEKKIVIELCYYEREG